MFFLFPLCLITLFFFPACTASPANERMDSFAVPVLPGMLAPPMREVRDDAPKMADGKALNDGSGPPQETPPEEAAASPAAPPEDPGCRHIRRGRFDGRPIGEILRTLLRAPIQDIAPARTAGRTVKAFLLLGQDFQVFFKPAHPNLIFARPKAEVGAFRLNRLLGCNHVPPAVLRDIDARRLRNAFVRMGLRAHLERLDRDVLATQPAEIRGAVLLWVKDVDVWDPPRELLDAMADPYAPLSAEMETLAWDLSWMLILDYLTNNYDRLTGGNILRRRADGRLVFIDNGAGFGADKPWKAQRRRANLQYLQRIHETFLQALEGLRLPLLQECMGDILYNQELRDVLSRRDELLEHFRRVQARHPTARFPRAVANP